MPVKLSKLAPDAANDREALAIGHGAYELDELLVAWAAWEKGASAPNTAAMSNPRLLFARELDPPDLDEVRRWWEKAAEAGHTLAP